MLFNKPSLGLLWLLLMYALNTTELVHLLFLLNFSLFIVVVELFVCVSCVACKLVPWSWLNCLSVGCLSYQPSHTHNFHHCWSHKLAQAYTSSHFSLLEFLWDQTNLCTLVSRIWAWLEQLLACGSSQACTEPFHWFSGFKAHFTST